MEIIRSVYAIEFCVENTDKIKIPSSYALIRLDYIILMELEHMTPPTFFPFSVDLHIVLSLFHVILVYVNKSLHCYYSTGDNSPNGPPGSVGVDGGLPALHARHVAPERDELPDPGGLRGRAGARHQVRQPRPGQLPRGERPAAEMKVVVPREVQSSGVAQLPAALLPLLLSQLQRRRAGGGGRSAGEHSQSGRRAHRLRAANSAQVEATALESALLLAVPSHSGVSMPHGTVLRPEPLFQTLQANFLLFLHPAQLGEPCAGLSRRVNLVHSGVSCEALRIRKCCNIIYKSWYACVYVSDR